MNLDGKDNQIWLDRVLAKYKSIFPDEDAYIAIEDVKQVVNFLGDHLPELRKSE